MKPKTCKRCGDVIPAKRLAAIPDATRCTPCQSRFDVLCEVPEYAMAVLGDFDDISGVSNARVNA